MAMLATAARRAAEFAEEQLSATLWVSVTAVVSDVLYNLVTHRLQRMAQVQRVIGSTVADTGAVCSAMTVASSLKPVEVCRASERARLLRRLRDSSMRYSLLVADTGSGMSSLLRRLACEHQCVKYVSFAGVTDIQGMTEVLRVEYGLRESERMPLSYLLFHKIVTGVAASAGQDDDTFDDDIKALRDACTIIESLAHEACVRCGVMPVLIVDHIDTLDESAINALQTWAAQAHRAPLHVTIATDSPHPFFGTALSVNMTLLVVRNPPVDDIIQYMLQRCPFLSDDQSTTLAQRVTGRYIGLAERVCRHLLEVRDDGVLDVDVGLKHVEAYMLRSLFAEMRSLHLYCLQPVGETDLDAERLGVFRVCMALLDLEYRAQRMNKLDKLDACAPEACTGAIDFGVLFSLCPLPVYLRLLGSRKGQLPLRTGFDSVSLKAPCYAMAMRWILGDLGTQRRDEAEGALALLQRAVEDGEP